jgi:hypothetical protein
MPGGHPRKAGNFFVVGRTVERSLRNRPPDHALTESVLYFPACGWPEGIHVRLGTSLWPVDCERTVRSNPPGHALAVRASGDLSPGEATV